jgi:predicted porin
VAPPAPAVKAREEKTSEFLVVAPRSKIKLSGRAWASVENVRADHGSRPNGVVQRTRTRITNDTSYFTVQGDLDVAPGWTALASLEVEFNLDGEKDAGFLGMRNAGVGLRGPMGTVIVGRWDSPSKQTTIVLDPFGGTGIFGYYNVFGQQQTSATGQGSNKWDRRLSNSVNYGSPDLAGLKVLAAYSVGETPQNGTTRVDPWTASGALQYRRGPLYAGVSYERRNDCGNPDVAAECTSAALGPKGTDTALRAGLGLTLKRTFTKLGAAYEHVSLEADATPTVARKTLRRDVYWGTITQGLLTEVHQLIVSYGYAADVSGSGVFVDDKDTGAWTLSAVYRFWAAKNLDLYGGYMTIRNRRNATYRLGSVNFGAVAVGSTTQGVGGGLRYYF